MPQIVRGPEAGVEFLTKRTIYESYRFPMGKQLSRTRNIASLVRPQRRHVTKFFDNPRNFLNNKINFLFPVINAQAKPDGALSRCGRYAHAEKHM